MSSSFNIALTLRLVRFNNSAMWCKQKAVSLNGTSSCASYAACTWDNRTDECQKCRKNRRASCVPLSGAHIYLNRVSLMNDIIIVRRWNAHWQRVRSDLFLVYLPRESLTALLQLCFEISHHWPSCYSHHLLCLVGFTAETVCAEIYWRSEILCWWLVSSTGCSYHTMFAAVSMNSDSTYGENWLELHRYHRCSSSVDRKALW